MSSVAVLLLCVGMGNLAVSFADHKISNQTSAACRQKEAPKYELFTRVVLAILVIIIVVLATISNSAILTIVVIESKFRTAVNAFIISQCAADLGLSLVVMPISLYGIVASDHEPMSRFLCRTQYYFSRLFNFMTVINLTAVLLDRYVIIVKPDFKARLSWRTIFYVIIVLWIIVAIANVPWEIMISGTFVNICLTSQHYYCIISYQGLRTVEKLCAVVRILLLGVIPFLFMFYFFFKIFRAVKTSRRRIGPTITGDWRKIAVKVYARSAYTTVLVIGSFLICITPHLLVTVAILANRSVSPAIALSTKLLSWTDTLIKPLIYLGRSRKYSYEIRQFIRKRLPLKNSVSRHSLKKYAAQTRDKAARMSSYAIEVTSPVHIPSEREFSLLFTIPHLRQSTHAWNGGTKF